MGKTSLALRCSISIIMIGVFHGSASGFGVSQSYWYPDYPMRLSPGETGIANLYVQNLAGDDDMDVTMTLTTNDANIASLPNDVEVLEFFMPLGSRETVPITVTVPSDANIGHEYEVAVETAGCSGGMFCPGIGVSWPVQVIPSKISIDDVSLFEGDNSTTLFEFTVNLSGATVSTVMVDYVTEDGSATLADNDYQFSSGTIIFEPNETAKFITVLVNGDTKHEIDETFLVNLSNPSNGTINDAQGVGTIQADDLIPELSINDVSLLEGNSEVTGFDFTVTLSHPIGYSVTVYHATEDGSATLADNDYQFSSGTIIFEPNETVKFITVLVNGDTKYEIDETFLVNLSNPSNATIIDTEGIGTIQNEDIEWLGILYVDDDASLGGDGTSWGTAYKYLQDALALTEYADEVLVAQGIYTPDCNSVDPNGTGNRTATFQLIGSVALRGGYAGFSEPDPNIRDFELYESILSGDLNGDDDGFTNNVENSYHVVTSTSAVLDGFIITGGNGNCEGSSYLPCHGGGIYASGNQIVSNCIVRGNRADRGGGMYCTGGTVTNCTFTNNSATASQFAGGLCNTGSPTVKNCLFVNNSNGGMTNTFDGYPQIMNCIFIGNSVWNNQTYHLATMTNCTFVDGSSLLNYYSNVELKNCIFWGASISSFHYDTRHITRVSYCNVQGGEAAVSGGGILDWGPGNIDTDPLFWDPLGPDGIAGTGDEDLHLLPDSLCIDAGDNNSVPEGISIDLDGHPRILDGDCNGTSVVDMGAYEFSYVYLGDFAGGCDVDFADFAVLALAWLSEDGQPQYDPDCDISIPADNKIDWLDLKVFTDNWPAGVE